MPALTRDPRRGLDDQLCVWTARPAIGSLAMIAEGLVSLALGLVLTWPMVPRDVIQLVAG